MNSVNWSPVDEASSRHGSKSLNACGLLLDRFLGNTCKSSASEVFLGKSVLKIYSKFTGEHPCQSVISVKLQSSFIEIALLHGCSPANLRHIFITPFPKNMEM